MTQIHINSDPTEKSASRIITSLSYSSVCWCSVHWPLGTQEAEAAPFKDGEVEDRESNFPPRLT